MQSATVFNIQKFSLNDGPGIRTVVFLKGCPLRCRWCANPESQHRAPETKADGTVVGSTKSVEDVMAVVRQDRPFYEDSGGGVTLSGGEALTWGAFALELLAACRAEGIDTCLETEAHVPAETFQAAAPLLDHLLVDLKHVDSARLREHTGVDGTLMLANLAWALAHHPDVLPRTPVVPGFNDDLDDARAMARWLRSAGGTRVQLLPYHSFGEGKYAELGRRYPLAGVPNLHPEDLEDYRQAWVAEGIDAFV